MGKKKTTTNKNRTRTEIETDNLNAINKIEVGSGQLGRGRIQYLLLEVLLDIRELLTKIKNKL